MGGSVRAQGAPPALGGAVVRRDAVEAVGSNGSLMLADHQCADSSQAESTQPVPAHGSEIVVSDVAVRDLSTPPALVSKVPAVLKSAASVDEGIAQSHSVGKSIETLRRRLLIAGEALKPCVEPAGRELVTETARLLAQQACRVAVVGQIKAGKSSFINAFMQKPGLLPTDVNPWTTAVTNLNFNLTAPADCAAKFQFFAEKEWDELIKGAGRMRELTKRLVPGFEPELLRRHVDALRRRAQNRLGDQFHALLGQSHSFDEIDEEVLTRYVCAGTYEGAGDTGDASSVSNQGRYADITRVADIYFSGGPFAFPMTFIDTPGTNDPFLLRDEVTRSSLEAADLYIVVLTARQPLADSDVALLRILRGLHKERILIFINRIDDLADIERDKNEVTKFVQNKIAQEFPGADIPVIAGSARWASFAMTPRASQFDQVVQPRVATYLAQTGAASRDMPANPTWREGEENTLVRDALFRGSGIPEAYRALASMLETSHCTHVLRQVAQCYTELARGAKAAARGELDHLNVAQVSAVSTASNAGDSLRKIDVEMQQLTDMSGVIESSARNLEKKLKDIIAEELEVMRAAMIAEVANQAREESNVLVDTLRRGRVPKVWRCEVGALRAKLNSMFHEGFERAASRVLEVQSRVSPELRQLTAMLAVGNEGPLEPTKENLAIPAPTTASLGRFIALDLDMPWWRAWWSRRPGSADTGSALEQLITSEFEPVVMELTGSARSALERYCAMTLRWSFGVCRNLIQSLQARGERLRETSERLSQSVDGKADDETVRKRAFRIGELRAVSKSCEDLYREFKQICGALDGMLQKESDA